MRQGGKRTRRDVALTPLKVKGKGPRKKAWAPPDPGRFKRIKRKQQQEDHDDDINDVSRNKATKRRRKKHIPHIEQLPNEILEQIFLLSENLNFPRSSLRIGFALSHPSLLLELTVGAFTPTWELWLGCRKQDIKSYWGHLDDYDRFGGNPDFQSAVLACRWMNVKLLENAQQVFRRRNKLLFAPRSLADGPDQLTTTTTTSNTSLEHLDRDLKALQIHCQHEDFYGAFGPKPQDAIFRLYGVGSYLEMHPLTRLPNHLLTGPFDNWEKVRFLFWMLRSGGHMFPPLSPHHQPHELTKRGYAQIVALEDPVVANLLLRMFTWIGAFEYWPLSLKEKKLEAAEHLDHINRGLIEEIFAEAL